MTTQKTSEKEFHDSVRMRLAKLGARLFRNNQGTAWYPKGAKDQKPVTYGLGKGTSDLVGWVPIEIRENMVGMTLAVFVAAEGKRGNDKARPEQQEFINRVHHDGGIAFYYKSPDSAEEALQTLIAYRKLVAF